MRWSKIQPDAVLKADRTAFRMKVLIVLIATNTSGRPVCQDSADERKAPHVWPKLQLLQVAPSLPRARRAGSTSDKDQRSPYAFGLVRSCLMKLEMYLVIRWKNLDHELWMVIGRDKACGIFSHASIPQIIPSRSSHILGGQSVPGAKLCGEVQRWNDSNS